jgi:folate-dependent phosphoribosylglycinamide formyltransferase PurN
MSRTNTKSLKFVALTTPGIASGTLLAYLIDSTGLHIEKMYIENNAATEHREKQGPSKTPKRWYKDWHRFRCHLGLALALPRVYTFRFLEKLFNYSELDFLYRCQSMPTRLFARACGFPLPPELQKERFLYTFQDAVEKHSLKVVKVPNFNESRTIDALRHDAPDVILGLGTRILSSELLSTAKIGVLNAHASLLPEYRGGVTEFWQLVHQETRTGVTIHWMTGSLDEGPICSQKEWPIPSGADHHRLRTMSLFYRLPLWRDVVEKLLRGEVPAQPQPRAKTGTFKGPSLQRQYDFYVRGLCLPRPCDRVSSDVRGMP